MPPQMFPNRHPWRPTNVKKAIVLFIPMFFTCGCTVGPTYKRPKVDVPGVYRGVPVLEAAQPQQGPSQQPTAPDETPSQLGVQPANNSPQQGAQPADKAPQQASAFSESSFGDQKWWEIFQDPQLQQLIRTALQNNYDVRIAATRILEAQAQLGITRADQLPTLSAGAAAINYEIPRNRDFPNTNSSFNAATASFNWQLDFWGKYRRATEAARANLLAARWARQYVISTLVGDVAASDFQLRALDLQLEISRRTLAARQESLKLTQTLANGGATTMLDVRQRLRQF